MSQATKPDTDDAVAAARDCATDFIAAFNAQNHSRLADTLNYPHLRLAAGQFVAVDSAGEFVRRSAGNDARLVEEGWHHTDVASMEVVHAGDDKVHLKLTINRCHEDGTVYNRFDTLWIVTRQSGHWGIQFRSSYLR